MRYESGLDQGPLVLRRRTHHEHVCTIYQPVPSRVKPKLVIWFPECLIVCKWPHSSLEELYAKARSAFPFEWRPACPSSSHFCRQYQIFLNFSSRLSAKEMPRALHVSLDLLLRGHYPPRQGNSMGPIHREPCIFSLTSFSLSNSFTGYIKTWSRIKISCKLAFNLTYGTAIIWYCDWWILWHIAFCDYLADSHSQMPYFILMPYLILHWRLIEPWTDCLFCLLRYQEFWQYSATIGELIFSLIVRIGSILAKVYIIPRSILPFHWAFLCLQNFSVTTVTKVPFLTEDHKNGESVSVSPFLWSPFRKETFATFITHNF